MLEAKIEYLRRSNTQIVFPLITESRKNVLDPYTKEIENLSRTDDGTKTAE